MKQKWENPSLIEMGVQNTNEGAGTFDDPHPDSEGPHIHKCTTCNTVFTTWGDLKVHWLGSDCKPNQLPMS
ncbi:MAG: hypothetical protein RSD47_08830 [Romboutsia sp.]